MGRRALVVTAAALTLTGTGCGLGPGPGTRDVTLTVTRGFGSSRIASTSRTHVPGSETVMRMLERSFRVATRYGGGFVESINGLSGGSSQLDWFYYVNGIEASAGARATAVHRGDRIWWDLHDWRATESIPAVVGSFPEPFVHGAGGRRLPTVLECGHDVAAACSDVSSELSKVGVVASSGLLGTGSGSDSLTVVIGTWGDLRLALVAALIERGPSASGVYARFAGRGRLLELLDPRGKVARTLGTGAGLIAATADSSSQPIWLITGTDRAGVAAAAHALTPSRLHDHFALAVQAGAYLPVPLQGAS
ncbi:MAG: DUF4430 domain-containing protein [Actinomycetota bacterium]|nr:DUF4430 domain-containing protein [Actinomycetota bacterium]